LIRQGLGLLGFAILLPVAALAQTQNPPPGEPPQNVRIQLGPLYLNPSLGLTNAGIDNNVFNEPDQQTPESDFTLTVTPATDYWLRFGRSWITGLLKEDLVYYSKFASERSANSSIKMNWLVPFNRFSVTPGVAFLNTRDRPGYEIDARSQRTELTYAGLVEMRTLAKTYVGVTGERRSVEFDSAATFAGVNLHDALSRTESRFGATLRHELTPLTSLTFDLTRAQDRFDLSPLRDSDSTLIAGGVKLDPFALIKGWARFGYRDFRPVDRSLPGYQGSTAAVDLTYVALGTTSLGFQLARDVQYSYDIDQPYYIQTGVSGSIQQQIYGPLDAAAHVGAARLDYQNRIGGAPSADRADHVRMFGGGIGYHIGRDVRISFNVDKQTRESSVSPYHGLRAGVSVIYGY